MLEKQQICEKRLDPQHAKETLAVFGAHFPDEKGEPIKTSTLSDVLKESAKWLAVDIAAGGKFPGGFIRWYDFIELAASIQTVSWLKH